MYNTILCAIENSDEAEKVLKKAYELSDELSFYRNKSESAALLFKLYRSLGKEKEAIFYVNEHLAIQDSLFSIEKINALSEMQTKYETEKKEAEITRQELKIIQQKNNPFRGISLFYDEPFGSNFTR